jgi:hypothetical protein
MQILQTNIPSTDKMSTILHDDDDDDDDVEENDEQGVIDI